MRTYPNQTGPIGPDTARPSQAADVTEQGPVRPVAPAPSSAERSDKVEISDASRALAARSDGTNSMGLDPARGERIRGRILSGAYDTLEVADAVARRLLDSADL